MLIQQDLIGAPIIEARYAGTFIIRHLSGNFELPTIPQIFGNPRLAEGMIAILQANHLGSVPYRPNRVSTPILSGRSCQYIGPVTGRSRPKAEVHDRPLPERGFLR